MNAFLDTHAVLLLEAGHIERFGAESRRLLGTGDMMVSPVVLLELHFMGEIGLPPKPARRVKKDRR